MNVTIFFVFISLAVIDLSLSAYCNGSPAPGERVNDYSIFDEDVTFIRSVKNGKLFMAGPSNARFPIVHVFGTPYEKGYAQGLLMKRDIRQFIYSTWAYLSGDIVRSLSGDNLSPAAKEILTQKGIDAMLDWASRTTAADTPEAYYLEVQGLSDATGISYDLLWRIQMFAEVTKASCSFFGAWDEATSNGHAYQLRALDYDTDGPFKDYPQVTVYHPEGNDGYAFAQVGFPGNVGVLTGFSENKIAISEIGVSYPDDSFGQGTDDTPPEKVHGEPWMFVLRDVLQYSTTLDAAKDRVANASRTCNLIIGLGDGNLGKSNGVEYSGRVANFYDDTNQLPVNETWHPQYDNIVYNGMDWLCPGYTGVLGSQLSNYRGAIDEIITIKNILPTVQTGSLHVAIYDLTASYMHLSFARGINADESEPLYAYDRQFTRLHMDSIFAESAPTEDQL